MPSIHPPYLLITPHLYSRRVVLSTSHDTTRPLGGTGVAGVTIVTCVPLVCGVLMFSLCVAVGM